MMRSDERIILSADATAAKRALAWSFRVHHLEFLEEYIHPDGAC